MITREQGYVTWEDAFLCLQSELLPDAIRAKFCEIIIGQFLASGTFVNLFQPTHPPPPRPLAHPYFVPSLCHFVNCFNVLFL